MGQNISLTRDSDFVIWEYENSSMYSTSFLYVVINSRGVTHVYIHVVWKL